MVDKKHCPQSETLPSVLGVDDVPNMLCHDGSPLHRKRYTRPFLSLQTTFLYHFRMNYFPVDLDITIIKLYITAFAGVCQGDL
jgi:hypothetical protein